MSLQFDNINCYPLGNAALNVVNNQLVVSNIGTSGLDGVMFEIPIGKTLSINHEAYKIQSGGNLSINSLSKDSIGNIYNSFTECIWHEENTQQLKFGYDFKKVPHTYNIVGYRNGIEIFNIPKENPFNDDPNGPNPTPEAIDWVIIGAVAAVVAAGVAVYELLDTDTHTKRKIEWHPDGSVKSIETITWEDPTPIDVDVDGQTYNVDTWGIKFKNEFTMPNDLIPLETIGIQLLGSKVNDIKIDALNLIDVENINL
jgi:hypothetical protein